MRNAVLAFVFANEIYWAIRFASMGDWIGRLGDAWARSARRRLKSTRGARP